MRRVDTNLRRLVRCLGAASLAGGWLQCANAAADRPSPPAVLLDQVTVLGSRLSRDGTDPGASSVSVYDRDFIEASGAMRLADFLNLLPQNYGGAGSGRSSAPSDLNPEFGLRTETSLPPFNFVLGAADVPLGQSGVSGANLRGLGSGSTLVFVDGRRQPIAALAAADPAQRFNPLVDARAAGPVHAALYETMTATETFDGTSELGGANLLVNGPLGKLPGGDVRLAVGGEFAATRREVATRTGAGAPVLGEWRRESHAAFLEFSVPVFGRANARPGLHRVELQLAGRYENHGAAGDSADPRVGVAWRPVESLLLRASAATGFRAPAVTECGTPTALSNSTLVDPRRMQTGTTRVAVTRGSNPWIRPETSRSRVYGAVFRPPFAPGFSVGVDYFRTEQRDAIQRLTPQAIVNNESLFPGRVVRRPANEMDLALNQPGEIVSVDDTFANFGEVRNESVDLTLDYDFPARTFGRLRASVYGTRTLVARSALRAGEAPIGLLGDTAAPPRWRWTGAAWWSGERRTVAVFVAHIGEFDRNGAGNPIAPAGYPSFTTMAVSGTHTFRDGLWRGRAKGLKIGVGIGNVFDRAPPFSNTVFGYNGGLHSPLGRTYEFSLLIPF